MRKGINNKENVKETLDCLRNRFTEFHRLKLDEITPLQIEKWRQRRHRDGVSAASINRQLNDLSACLSHAVNWTALTSNPVSKVKRTKIDQNTKVRYLSPTEEASLRTKLDEREASMRAARRRANEWRAKRNYPIYAELTENEFVDHLKPAVLLSLNTGLRLGELLNLRWSDIDFDQEHLTVIGEGAKSGQTRHVPLNREALDVLKHWKQQPGIKSQKWIWHGKDGKPFKNLRTSWIGILSDAEITNFRWHDLRHTFASNLVMASVSLYKVMTLLGHSDYKMTKRYAHLAPGHLKDAVYALDRVQVAR